MLSVVGDGHADVMAHALNFVSLTVEQGMRMYTAVRAVRIITHESPSRLHNNARLSPSWGRSDDTLGHGGALKGVSVKPCTRAIEQADETCRRSSLPVF